jgi:MFS family permease
MGLGFGYVDFLRIQLIAVLFFAVMVPIAGALADRFGRRGTLLVITTTIILYGASFGLMLAPDSATKGSALLFLIIGMTLMGLSFGPMSAVLPELFPTNVRYTGSGIAYNVSGILGAAVAPFIATWLATKYGVAWVGVYLIGAAILTFIALLLMRETKDISLEVTVGDHVGDAVHPG